MSTLHRYLMKNVETDLTRKMVFLGGPRQVGKTFFAQSLIPSYKDGHTSYLNWDDLEDRKKIKAGIFDAKQKLIILDEIHKFVKWRSLVKGFFDKLKNTHQFLVTGSARLDYYRKGGDSLLGRYHYYRMHPFTLCEVSKSCEHRILQRLLEFGGFPEPYINASAQQLKRWHRQRRERIVYSDIRDLENVKEISNIEILMEALPDRVGSPLSRKNLAEDLEVDFKTVEKWISILENVYYCYRIAPYGAPRIKAVKKEQKIYLWDWSELDSPGSRWENLVASHLLKFCHYHEDTQGDRMELRFLRDITAKEVDFVVLKNKKPLFAVECKTGEKNLSRHISYFSERTPIPKFYQVHQGTTFRTISDKIHILPFTEFCKIEKLK
ncbi:MAG: ATP-binding protein [Bdellovibrionales bacterium]|nr:ATP-binding protein [Bdellovibrionales bacterium]